jgi:hypothetical protein
MVLLSTFHLKGTKKVVYQKLISCITAFSLLFLYILNGVVYAEEDVQAFYTGMNNAHAVISSIDYPDASGLSEVVRQAIYKSRAFGILRRFGTEDFHHAVHITKEQAIAIAYRMAGKEKEAEEMLQKYLNMGNPQISWSDGYLLLAADEELVSSQDLADAFGQTTEETPAAEAPAFDRNAPVERQEIAYWIAKAMELDIDYEKQKAYSSFSDREHIDVEKLPYVETVLANGIMGLDGNGRFNSVAGVTGEQAAYIIKNSEKFILQCLGYQKHTGTIENVNLYKDYTSGNEFEITSFDIRNTNGRLHRLNVSGIGIDNRAGLISGNISNINEQTYEQADTSEKEVVVYREGLIGDSALLKQGDRIEYFADGNNVVVYINVLSGSYDTEYIVAMIKDMDFKNLVLWVDRLFTIESPDIEEIRDTLITDTKMDTETIATNVLYRYANNITVESNGSISEIDALKPGVYVILTTINNMVTAAMVIDPAEAFIYENQEKGIVMGIVEDNNPYLGYITLYLPDGSGVSPEKYMEMIKLRTYNYKNPNEIEVYKNHERARVEEIEPGDSVYMKLDEYGEIVSISAVDNYIVKYAKVITKNNGFFTVQYDDGTQQILDINAGTPVFADKRTVGVQDIKDGERVRLLLHVTPQFTRVKEIVLEGKEHIITNIYKGKISNVNAVLGSITVYNTEVLKNGVWTRVEKAGVLNIELAKDVSIYSGEEKIGLSDAANKYKGAEAYFAVTESYGGVEQAVLLTYRNRYDAEDYPYDDLILSVSGRSGMLLERENKFVELLPSTIVVKDGRLVSGFSISPEDAAFIIANRSSKDGSYYAGVVCVENRLDSATFQVYRGRIKDINPSRSFTVESFSTLGSTGWQYANTPRTFNITFDTRILDDEGVISQRDFTGYGDNSFLNRTVYIVAVDINAVLVSTAPYGYFIAIGEVYEYLENGDGQGDQGNGRPVLKICNSKIYSPSDYLWVNKGDMQINILKNTVIIKGDKIINASDLKKGDRVRVIKKDESVTGDGYVIIVE